MIDPIYNIALFHDVTDDELQWLIDHSHEQRLQSGDYFTHENEPTREFYIVLEGELQVIRTVNGQESVMGTTPRGIMGGEVWLLSGGRDGATVRAIAPTRLMVFDYAHFLQIFSQVPPLGVQILRVAVERLQGYTNAVKQREKLAALGKLSAGLAHELNNPASAARRAASTLQATLPTLSRRTLRLSTWQLNPAAINQLVNKLQELVGRIAHAQPLSTLEQGDCEEEMYDWLRDQGIEQAVDDLAATFVTAHVRPAELTALLTTVPTDAAEDLLYWLHAELNASGLLDEIEQSTRRMADLVAAVKGYTYMDQGGQQAVDLHRDLENTLRVLKHKLNEIAVERDFDPNLPTIMGQGGDLNQVWTNLIDNAIDALNGRGTIRLITRCENNYVMVEISDDGPGIPPAILPRIFEPFFTTKAVGVGTGMGLDTSYRIVHQHNGTIEVQSKPGHTRFIVRLPVGGAD